jgi:DNA-binding CsgD family transcriptional regulator/PAS domain-containing protein
MERFSTLVEAIYGATLDPDAWSKLAVRVAERFAAESCFLGAFDEQTGAARLFAHTKNVDARAHADYAAHYHKTDLWVHTARATIPGVVFLGTDVVDEPALVASEFYNDWCKRVGIFHALGFLAPIDENVFSAVGIHRSCAAQHFDDGDKHTMRLLLPHLTKSLHLTLHLEHLRHGRKLALQAVDTLGAAVVVVDANRRLLLASARAESLLEKRSDLTVSQGILRARLPARDQELARAVHHAALAAVGRSASPGGVVTIPCEDGSTLSLMVSPLPPDATELGAARPIALIFLSGSGDRAVPSAEALARFYGLSPAEARLAAALLSGERLEAYAERAQISRETARTLLARTFRKTGCSRQADLIREALTNPLLTPAKPG